MSFDLRSNIKNKPNAQGTLFRHVGSVIPQLTHAGELVDHGTETGMPPHQEAIYRGEQYIGRG